jgi:hypothetical protein
LIIVPGKLQCRGRVVDEAQGIARGNELEGGPVFQAWYKR